jgi:hypothetical protein
MTCLLAGGEKRTETELYISSSVYGYSAVLAHMTFPEAVGVGGSKIKGTDHQKRLPRSSH